MSYSGMANGSPSTPRQEIMQNFKSISERDEESEVNRMIHAAVTGKSDENRREIRKHYRRIIKELTENPEERSRPADNRLAEHLASANEAFCAVDLPREAACDSEVIGTMASLAKQQASLVNTNFVVFDQKDFARTIRKWINTSRNSLPQIEQVSQPMFTPPKKRKGQKTVANTFRAWVEFGRTQRKEFLVLTPSIRDLHSAVSDEGAPKKPMKSQQVKSTQGKEVDETKARQPVRKENFSSHTKEEECKSEEVEKISKILWKYYKEHRKAVDYFEFILNPDSFSQTVENIFFVSFLIKDANAKLYFNDLDIPVLQPQRPTSKKENVDANPVTKTKTGKQAEVGQIIISIDQQHHQKLVQAYGRTTSIIPTRRTRAALSRANAPFSEGSAFVMPTSSTAFCDTARAAEAESQVSQKRRVEERSSTTRDDRSASTKRLLMLSPSSQSSQEEFEPGTSTSADSGMEEGSPARSKPRPQTARRGTAVRGHGLLRKQVNK